MIDPIPRTWRLLVDDAPGEGAWNMALDRAIQLECAAGRSPATLRLYRWARPTVSLGRFQDLESVDLDECALEGIDVVRRYTGGRGVLHDDELTYSVVASVGDGVPRGTGSSYRFLCAALVDAYRHLGVEAETTRRPRGTRSSGACYLHATPADVSVGMRKVSGSAQVWYRDVVLQHGSFVLTRDVDRERRAFRLSALEARELAAGSATIADLANMPTAHRDIATAVIAAFERLFGVRLEPGTVNPGEVLQARVLVPDVNVASKSMTTG